MKADMDGDRLVDALGACVREYRTKAAISQEELADRAELDRTYISAVERGLRNPTVKSLLRIARALSIRPSLLLAAAEQSIGVTAGA